MVPAVTSLVQPSSVVEVNAYPNVPVAVGVPLMINEEPETSPFTPGGRLPVMEITAPSEAVYIMVLIGVPWFTVWLAV
jgi:hypothetical protein